MPTFEITAPDGKKFRVEAPEGATADQAMERVKSQYAAAPESAQGGAFTDVPKEVGGAVADALKGTYEGLFAKPFARAQQAAKEPISIGGALRRTGEDLADVGKGTLSALSVPFSPLVGTARSLIGHPLADLVNATAPPGQGMTYDEAKGKVDLAMSGLGARGVPPPVRVTPKMTAGLANEKLAADVGIPLSRGQSTSDLDAIRYEDMASRGAYGKPAQEVAAPFFEQQFQDVQNAGRDVGQQLARGRTVAADTGEAAQTLNTELATNAERARAARLAAEQEAERDAAAARGSLDTRGRIIGDVVAEGRPAIESPRDAGEVVAEQVRQQAARDKAEYQARYKEFRDLPGQFQQGAFRGVGSQIRDRLTANDDPVVIDDVTTPIAARAIADVDRFPNLRIPNPAEQRAPSEGRAAKPAAPQPSAETSPLDAPIAKQGGPRDPSTYSLFEYLASRGGLRPTPELRSILGGNPFVPGFGRLLREGGMPLDRAWEATARDARYLFDASDIGGGEAKTSTNQLLDLIAEEGGGNKQYQAGLEGTKSKSQLAHEAEASRVQIERALDDHLAESGVGEVDPKLYKRTVQIMEREGVSDPDIAFERAVMENAENYERLAQTRREVTGEIAGWDAIEPGSAHGRGEGIPGTSPGLDAAGSGQGRGAGDTSRVSGQAGEAVAVDLRGVDQARKRLVAFYKAARNNPSDARAISRIISEFDNSVEQAITNGLFSGDERALGALQDARGAYSSYARTYRPQQAGDDVGTAIRRIVDRHATAEETANMIVGSGRVGNSGLPVRIADRLEQILGRNSDAWSTVRQAIWQRASMPRNAAGEVDAARAATGIQDLANSSLGRRIFNEAELNAMRSHAQGIRDIERSIEALPSSRRAEAQRNAYEDVFGGGEIGGAPGTAFRRIVDGTATPEETANAVFGIISGGNPGNASRMIRSVERVVGPDSEAMAAIRQGVWQKLTQNAAGKDQPGQQKLHQAINEFLNGKGRSIAQSLYSADELDLMRRYAQAVRLTIIPKYARTNSDTAPAIMNALHRFGGAIATALGYAVDHTMTGGLVAGYAVNSLLKKGVGIAADSNAARKTAKQFEPLPPLAPTTGPAPSRTQIGVGMSAPSRASQSIVIPALQSGGIGRADQDQPNVPRPPSQ